MITALFVTLISVTITDTAKLGGIEVDIVDSGWSTHRILRRSAGSGVNWAFDRINQHSKSRDGKVDRVAEGNLYVVGSGVRATHIEFSNRVAEGFSFDKSDSREDCGGYGTGAASIAIGEHFGISRAANVIPVKVGCNDQEISRNFRIAAQYIRKHINTHSASRAAILIAFKPGKNTHSELNALAKDHLVVIAAGDDSRDICAEYKNLDEAGIMIVAGSDQTDNQTANSNYGSCVDIFGPGQEVSVAGNRDDTSISTESGTVYAAAAVAGVAMNQLIQAKEANDVVSLKSLLLGHSTAGALTLTSNAQEVDTPNRLVFDICPYYKLPEQGKCYVAQTKQLEEKDSNNKMRRVAKSVITFDYMAYNYYEDCFSTLVFASDATTSRVEAVHQKTGKKIEKAIYKVHTRNDTIRFESGPKVYVNDKEIDLSKSYRSVDYSILTEKIQVKTQDAGHKFVPVITIHLPDNVTVSYDGDQEIRVALTNTEQFYGKTQGICGFYDKSHVIEFVDKEGKSMEFTYNENKEKFVKEWTIDEYDCPDDVSKCKKKPECYSTAKEVCYKIIDPSSCMSNCFEKLSPRKWYENCVEAVTNCCECDVDINECACTEQNKYYWATLLETCAACPPPCDKPCVALETDKECRATSKLRKPANYYYEETIEYIPKDNCHCNPEHKGIECNHDTTWTPPKVPDCQRKTCGAPSSTPLAPISSGEKLSYSCGDKVEYSCAKSKCPDCNCYTMEGKGYAECVGGEGAGCIGLWNRKAPVCTLNHCQEPKEPSVDVIINTSDPLSWVNVTDTSCCSGSATFHCHECYTHTGPAETTCCNNKWGDGSLPTCKIKECVDPELEIKESGDQFLVVDAPDTFCSHGITYRCNSNCYELDGDSTRTCNPDGSWSGALPKCVKKKCPVLDGFDDGSYTIDGSSIQKGVQLECGDSVKVTCNDCNFPCSVCDRTCQWDNVNGTTVWSNSEAQCQQRYCVERNLTDASIRENTGALRCGETSTAECNKCYRKISGSDTRKCIKDPRSLNTCPETGVKQIVDGVYDREELVCKKMVCDSLDEKIKNNFPLSIKDKSCTNELECDCTITFECPACYELKGKRTLRCDGDNWNYEVPTCQIRTCPVPGPSVSRYFTNYHSRGCQFKNDGDLVEDYKKSKYECGDVLTVNSNDTECVHVCDKGTFTCLPDGSWNISSIRYPTCYLVHCDDPAQGVNATLLTNTQDEDDRECADSIQYKCNKCHKLKSGNLNRRCEAIDVDNKWDGEWSGDAPVCERIMCDQAELPAIVNGTIVNTIEEKCGEKISYACDKCNRLVGNTDLLCEQTDLSKYLATWTNIPPTCEPICCPALLPTHSGEADYDVISTGVRYLHGPIKMHVEKSLMSVKDNYDVCNENYVCQQIEAKCDECYEYNGTDYAPVRECVKYGSDTWYGKWKHDDKICTRKECEQRVIDVEKHVHYKIISMIDTKKCNQTVEIECDKCYKITDDSISESHQCKPNKLWDQDMPTCVPITCATPEQVEYATWDKIQSSSADVCGVIQYTCNPCYELVGNATLHCVQNQGTGTASWNSAPPVCQPVCCPHFENPVDSHTGLETTKLTHLYPDITLHLTESEMSVKTNYETCQKDYVCQEIDPECGECFEYTEQDARYDEDGISRPPNRQCLKSNKGDPGVWSNTKNCTIKTCPYRDTTGKHIHYTAPDKYSSHYTSKCLDEVTVTCDDCYQLPEGNLSETHTCLNTKEWSRVVPTCIKKECPTPPVIDNCKYKEGSNLCDSARELECEECYYHETCKDERQLHDAMTVSCTNDKAWSWEVEEPKMNIKECEEPGAIEHGQRDYSGLECGDMTRYTCDRCYKFSHESSCLCEKRKCVPDPTDCTRGMWNATAPTCHIIRCGSLPAAPENGKVVGDLTDECDGMVQYECDEGYYLVDGDANRTCTETGTWTGKHPVCKIKQCTEFKEIPHTEPSTEENTFGTVVTFTCDDCYEFDPKFLDESVKQKWTIFPRFYMLYCEETGNWNGSAPICREKTCDNPGRPSNGHIIEDKSDLQFRCRSTVHYQCNVGYKFTSGSSSSISCDGKKWSGAVPRCEPVDCGDVDVVEPLIAEYWETTYDHEVTYKCGEGREKFCYEDPEPEKVECKANGLWETGPGSCTRMQCPSKPTIANGSLQKANNYLADNDCGQKFHVQCDSGYKITGRPWLYCRQYSKKMAWFPPRMPKCVIKTCSVQQNPLNGQVVPSMREQNSDKSKIQYGSVLTYKCDKCFRHDGARSRICKLNDKGVVEWDTEEPECQDIECDIPSIANGYIEDYSPQRLPECGEAVTVMCDYGYKLQEGSVRTAECLATGNYDVGHFPPCDRIVCPDPERIDNGVMRIEYIDESKMINVPYTRVIYTCNEGYEQVLLDRQKEEVVCLSDGVWDGLPPTCKFKKCDPLSDPANGRVIRESDAVSRIVCNDCYEPTDEGRAKVICNNGVWINQPTKCREVKCGSPGNVENGRTVRDEGRECGNVVSYKCDSGFVRHGQKTLECLKTGQWSALPPQCIDSQCPELAPVPHATASVTNNGKKIQYICNAGYELMGDAVRHCMNGSQWSGPGPTSCTVKHCGEASKIQFGTVTVSNKGLNGMDDTFGARVRYACMDSRYQLTGDDERECTQNKEWSKTLPRCVCVSCPVLTLTNGRIEMSNGHSVDSVIEYKCDDGFKLEGGTAKRTCMSHGEWNGKPATCKRIKCSKPRQPASTKKSGSPIKSEYSYLENVFWKCLPSGNLLEFVCEKDGTWGGDYHKECADL